jgi:hypothetical protein
VLERDVELLCDFVLVRVAVRDGVSVLELVTEGV